MKKWKFKTLRGKYGFMKVADGKKVTFTRYVPYRRYRKKGLTRESFRVYKK